MFGLRGLRKMSSNLGWIPIVAGTSLLVGLIVPYYIAVHLGHVYPILPYISDTGALHPENCVFGQMLNLSSALFTAMVYLRYRQTKQFYKDGPKDLMAWNVASSGLGYCAGVGFSLVANVQIDVFSSSSVESSVHLFSAVFAFGGGIFYGFTQSWITYAIGTDTWSRVMAGVRFAISLTAGISSITLLAFRELAYAEFNGTYYQTLQWNPNDGGYEYHLYSSVSEYLTALTLLVLILTMFKEFKTITTRQQMPPPEKEVEGYVIETHGPPAYLRKEQI